MTSQVDPLFDQFEKRLTEIERRLDHLDRHLEDAATQFRDLRAEVRYVRQRVHTLLPERTHCPKCQALVHQQATHCRACGHKWGPTPDPKPPGSLA